MRGPHTACTPWHLLCPSHLPSWHACLFFQMGSDVLWKTMPYLAWSARTFSIIRQHTSTCHDAC